MVTFRAECEKDVEENGEYSAARRKRAKKELGMNHNILQQAECLSFSNMPEC